MTVIVFDIDFSICKLPDFSKVSFEQEFSFFAKTDDEYSLVCPTDDIPRNTISTDDGWRMFRFAGSLDFSLVGILSRVTSLLSQHSISVFALSTFDTDYILVKKSEFGKAMELLKNSGYSIKAKRI